MTSTRTSYMRALVALVALVAAMAALLIAYGASPARAEGVCSTTAGTTTCTFASTGAEDTFEVPDGVSSVHVEAIGAPGAVGLGDSPAGNGAQVSGDLTVTPGQKLYVNVGGAPTGKGTSNCHPFVDCIVGFNGGGPSQIGEGGGGASDVRTEPRTVPLATTDSRLIVAGGGGYYGGGGGGGITFDRDTGDNSAAGGGGGGSNLVPAGGTATIATGVPPSVTISYTDPAADTTPPVVTVPGPITNEATSPDGAVVTFNATAEDAVDGSVDVSCTPPSGSTFPIGTTSVGCSATDAAGNTSTATFSVTVRDTTAPSITPHPTSQSRPLVLMVQWWNTGQPKATVAPQPTSRITISL